GREATADLFGEWQTELYRAPPVVDGRVPRNDYGRIDLFTSTMLPDGAAHVPDSNAKRVCQELGIDAVDAVTSFEFRRGTSTPVLQGVVIPHDSLELVKDALHDDRQGAKVRRLEKMEKRA
ncbi:DNA repair protein Rad4, partial [Coemansia reversa NRRL 1564]